MDNKRDPSKDMMTAFEAMEDEILWLHAKWKIYRQLFATSEERISLLNDFARDFFQVVHDSLLYDILITISRLTDPAEMAGKDNLTFQQLIRMLEAGSHRELVDKLTSNLKTAEDKCKAIRPWRNRLIAHKDLGTALQYHPDPLPGVSRQMIEEVLATFREYMTELHMALKNAETDYADVPLRGDGDQIVWYLKEAKAYRKHRVAGHVDPEEDGILPRASD